MVRATRIAVRFAPPAIAVEYAEDGLDAGSPSGKENLKVLEVDFETASAASGPDSLLREVQARHPQVFNDKTVSLPQVCTTTVTVTVCGVADLTQPFSLSCGLLCHAGETPADEACREFAFKLTIFTW